MALDIRKIQHEDSKKNDDKAFGILKNVMASNHLDSFLPTTKVIKDFKTVSLGRDSITSQNQYSSGRCWIFTGINLLRRSMILANSKLPPSFNLSHSFIYFYALLEQCNKVLEMSNVLIKDRKVPIDSLKFRYIAGTGLHDGGSYDTFVALIKKYGIVPLDIYPDTFQSRHTSTLLSLLSTVVKQGVVLMSENEDFKKVKDSIMIKIHHILSIFLGSPPSSFEYGWPTKNGSKKFAGGALDSFTPESFYKKQVVMHMKTLIAVTNDPRKKAYHWIALYNSCEVIPKGIDIKKLDNYVFELVYNLDNVSDIKVAILRSLKAKKAVQVSCDVDNFFNKDSNLMAYEASSIPRIFDVDVWNMKKINTLETNIINNSHIVTVIGYDKSNDIWEVENSWGDSKPITLSGSWFDRFVLYVYLEKKFLNKEIQTKIKETPLPTKPNYDVWVG